MLARLITRRENLRHIFSCSLQYQNIYLHSASCPRHNEFLNACSSCLDVWRKKTLGHRVAARNDGRHFVRRSLAGVVRPRARPCASLALRPANCRTGELYLAPMENKLKLGCFFLFRFAAQTYKCAHYPHVMRASKRWKYFACTFSILSVTDQSFPFVCAFVLFCIFLGLLLIDLCAVRPRTAQCGVQKCNESLERFKKSRERWLSLIKFHSLS